MKCMQLSIVAELLLHLSIYLLFIVKTEHLTLTVVTLCQCREMDVKEEQRVAIKLCCKVDFWLQRLWN
jgi:hypothetical protein